MKKTVKRQLDKLLNIRCDYVSKLMFSSDSDTTLKEYQNALANYWHMVRIIEQYKIVSTLHVECK